MKIGFVGPGATGKSVLLHHLVENKIIECKPLPSIVRGIFKKWNIKEGDQLGFKPEDALKLQMEIIDARVEAEREAGDCFISDRTLLDHFCYTIYRCNAAMTDDQYRTLWSLVQKNMETYDAVYFFPYYDSARWHRINDGFRQASGLAYGRVMDALMQHGLKKLKSHGFLKNSYMVMLDDDVKDRAELIKRDLGLDGDFSDD